LPLQCVTDGFGRRNRRRKGNTAVNATAPQIDLSCQPTELSITGGQIRVVDEIKLRGGFVLGMTHKRPGHYTLRIYWPQKSPQPC
jgi:hypothetical protein